VRVKERKSGSVPLQFSAPEDFSFSANAVSGPDGFYNYAQPTS